MYTLKARKRAVPHSVINWNLLSRTLKHDLANFCSLWGINSLGQTNKAPLGAAAEKSDRHDNFHSMSTILTFP